MRPPRPLPDGDAYGIGILAPYDIYIWNAVKKEWKNNGPIQGPAGPQGESGSDGKAATVRVGAVTTGEPGSQAAVSNGGTESDAVFNFTIPRGADGRDGAEGPAGADGKSAYQSAKEQGYTGTEAEFYAALVSLKDGPFLPLSGGTLSGNLRTNAEIIVGVNKPAFTFEGDGMPLKVWASNVGGEALIKFGGTSDSSGGVFAILEEGITSAESASWYSPNNPTSLVTKKYVDELVGNINTVLDTINGEVI
ncbi:hypothetical protein B5G40_08890 [Flavonifractor sp. An9]|nr:hypothetical protein B5G40_08890 [Flavonifractor sp. An9]